MAEEIQFGPEQRRGEQQARFGRGPSQMVGIGNNKGKGARRQLTPREQAAWKLNQALEKYPVFTEEARQDLQNEFVEMPNLRTMNMKVMAATLAFLVSINNNPTPNSFQDAVIMPHLDTLLPTKNLDPDVRRRLIVRFKAEMFIYVRAITIFRNKD